MSRRGSEHPPPSPPLSADVVLIPVGSFPYLTMINSVLPALIAGNTVIIKPSPQTPTPAERLSATLCAAGLPSNVVQVAHLSPEGTARLAADPRIGFLSFTGSVKGGKALAKAAVDCEAFKGVALELGGKDPAYVRPEVDVKWAAAELVDGTSPRPPRPPVSFPRGLIPSCRDRRNVQLGSIVLRYRTDLRPYLDLR